MESLWTECPRRWQADPAQSSEWTCLVSGVPLTSDNLSSTWRSLRRRYGPARLPSSFRTVSSEEGDSIPSNESPSFASRGSKDARLGLGAMRLTEIWRATDQT